MKRIFALILFLNILTIPAFATTYYVDTSGNDSNIGSIGSPFKTIQKGSDTAIVPGDIVCINNGTYSDTVSNGGIGATFTKYGNPGTVNNPITFRNCQGGSVIIDASSKTFTFTHLSGNLWEADNYSVGSTSLVWKNDAWLGQPQSSCSTVTSQNRWCRSSNNRLEIYSTTDPNLDTFVQNYDVSVEIRNTAYVVLDGLKIKYANWPLQIGNHGSGNQGATHDITVKNGEIAFGMTRGIRVIGDVSRPTDHIYIHDMLIHDVYDTINSGNGHGIKFDANEDGYENSYAYAYNNTIYNCSGHGIQFSDGWQIGYFYSNYIHDIAQIVSGNFAAIRCGDVFTCNVYDNELYGGTSGKGSGLWLDEKAQPSYVYRNYIHGFSFYGIRSGSQFKTPTDLHIYNNLIDNNSAGGMSFQATNIFYVYNNTVTGNGQHQINISGTAQHGFIRNNIFYSSNSTNVISINGALGGGIDAEDHNSIFAVSNSTPYSFIGVDYNVTDYQVASGFGSGDLQSNPALNGSLEVITSPTVNAGTDAVSSELTTDYLQSRRPQGSGWDIGAYELSLSNPGMNGGAKNLGGAILK